MTILKVVLGAVAFVCLVGSLFSGVNGKAGATAGLVGLAALCGAIAI